MGTSEGQTLCIWDYWTVINEKDTCEGYARCWLIENDWLIFLKEGKYDELMCVIECTLKCDPRQFVDFQYYDSLDGLLAIELIDYSIWLIAWSDVVLQYGNAGDW